MIIHNLSHVVIGNVLRVVVDLKYLCDLLGSGLYWCSAFSVVNHFFLFPLVNFSDEQMLIDMVRENITQRDTDYHDTREGIVLARQWKQSKVSNVKQFNKTLSVRGRLGEGRPQEPDSCRNIATFLSKHGKAISHQTVKNYLDVTK